MDLKRKNQIVQDFKIIHIGYTSFLLSSNHSGGEGRKVNVPYFFTFENCLLVHVAICAPLLLQFKSSFLKNFSK